MVRFVAPACFGLSLSVWLAACETGRPIADLGNGNEGGAGGEPGVECDEGPGYAEASDARQIDAVTATLVDLDDEPVPNEMVQVCGTDVCIIGESDAAGEVSITPLQPMTKPALKFGEGRQSAKFAWLLPEDGTSFELGAVRTVLLPPLGTGAPLVPGELASSGGLSLLPAEDATIAIDLLTFQNEDERALRAVRIPLERAPAVVDASLGFEIVVAATPTDTVFCPPASLRLENTEGWEPGTAVEIWLHGTDITEEWARYGGWAKVTDAEVSADGAEIETTSPGLPVLGVLGFKRR